MAGRPPPPPVKSEPGSFAWTTWYNNLYEFLINTGSVAWASVDKSGASLTDLPTRLHSSLQSVAGTGSSHLSTTEAARVTATMTMNSSASDPTTATITASNWAIYKNTTSGLVKLWVNDAGTMKSVLIA